MKTLFTLLISAVSLSAMGQSQFDPRLLSRYSEERIAELSDKQPATIEYWTYYLEHSYSIVDNATGKSIETNEEIKIKDFEKFNILDLDIHMDRNKSKVYKIKGTDQYLLLKSNDQFSKEFSRNRSN